jgi:6-phosphogluconolactonase
VNIAWLRWHVLDDAETVARSVAHGILRAARRAQADRGLFRLVLAGGSTPRRCYELLAKAEADWSRWAVYFGDERCLPPSHPQRNSRMAAEAWLDHVPIPAAHIHPIPAELGAEEAARRYAVVVENAVPFDLVLLGMGEDGHTASLFPGQEHDPREWVHAVHGAPKPPPDRVSLSVRALSAAREAHVLVTGRGKCAAVARWRAGADLPVARIRSHTGLDVWLDRAADRCD